MQSIETKQSWLVAGISLVILGVSWGGPWVAAVGMIRMAADLGGARSIPALAAALAWVGSGVGGIFMGRIADRFGVRVTIPFGVLMIAAGLWISTLGGAWALYIGHGLFMGLIGNGGINAPLYIYVSRWFDRRRGSALALISSGTYIAGAIWPPIFARAIATFGWQKTMVWFGAVEVVVILPLALTFLRAPPEHLSLHPVRDIAQANRPLGWNPNGVLALLAVAAFACCVPMAMPQQHMVAFCTDLGLAASVGATILSFLLATAFISRQVWGWLSDRIGGLATILAGSSVQIVAMVAFLFTQDEVGLFTVAGLYGLGFSAIIPAYVLAVRDLFPAAEAGWRVPIVLLCNNTGMAFGGWFAGDLYDRTGTYASAFSAGILFNIINLLIIGILVLRQRRERAVLGPAETSALARAAPAMLHSDSA